MVMAPSVLASDEIYVSSHYQNDSSKDPKLISNSNHGVNDLSKAKLASKDLVFDVLKKRVAAISVDHCEPGEEDAFYVADMGEIYRQHLRWKMNLGRVKPFYGTSPLFDRSI
jgi:ornithine decarboxylase